jgi:hypothetical protein
MEGKANETNVTVLETPSLTRCFGEDTPVDALTVSAAAGEVFGLLHGHWPGPDDALLFASNALCPWLDLLFRVTGNRPCKAR